MTKKEIRKWLDEAGLWIKVQVGFIGENRHHRICKMLQAIDEAMDLIGDTEDEE